MSNLTTMKARVASELRRSNITTQIASAISTAIAAYQGERWMFNEYRDKTFATVSSQEFYTSSDDADIGLLVKLDYMKLLNGNTPYTLNPADPSTTETLSDSGTITGQPTDYVWYQQRIRLYPVPDAIYTVRMAGVFIAAEPATDGEASNPWMTTGERLIRSRAKWELAKHVLYDADLASNMAEATMEAWGDMKARTNRQTGRGLVRAMAY